MRSGTIVRLGLEGRKALVTGASEGIGAACARALALEGVDVALCARSAATLVETARRIEQESGRLVVPVVADLSTLEGCETFVRAALDRLGRIDILVNNAGSSRMMPFADMPDEVFVEAFQGKLFAAARCSRAVIAPMKAAGGGVILNITGATQQGVPLHSAGGSANAGLRMLSKVLSLELAPWNIRVNSVAPGRVRTERLQRIVNAEAAAAGKSVEAVAASMTAAIPAGRLGETEDIARVVCFLASDLAAYINGAAIPVDGGKSPLF